MRCDCGKNKWEHYADTDTHMVYFARCCRVYKSKSKKTGSYVIGIMGAILTLLIAILSYNYV
jgi:hypothetical protein